MNRGARQLCFGAILLGLIALALSACGGGSSTEGQDLRSHVSGAMERLPYRYTSLGRDRRGGYLLFRVHDSVRDGSVEIAYRLPAPNESCPRPPVRSGVAFKLQKGSRVGKAEPPVCIAVGNVSVSNKSQENYEALFRMSVEIVDVLCTETVDSFTCTD